MTEWKVNNCPKCGGPLKSMSENIKFCPYCGVELEKVIPEGKFTLNINKNTKKEIVNKNVNKNVSTNHEVDWTGIAIFGFITILLLAYILYAVYIRNHPL